MPPNSSPTPSASPNLSPHTSPLDGSLGLFLVMLFLVLALIAATCLILYRIHLRNRSRSPPASALRRLFLPALAQSSNPDSSSRECLERKTSSNASLNSEGKHSGHTPKSWSSRFSTRVASFASTCKLSIFSSDPPSGTMTPTSTLPAIVVSACSPSVEKPPPPPYLSSEPTVTGNLNSNSRNSPSPTLLAPGPQTPTKRTVKPPRPSVVLVNVSNRSGVPSGVPFELVAPPPAKTGQVRRVSVKRHSRHASISTFDKENKENATVPLQRPVFERQPYKMVDEFGGVRALPRVCN